MKNHKIILLTILGLQSGFVSAVQTPEEIAKLTAARIYGESIANSGNVKVTSVLNHGEAQEQMKTFAGYDEQKVADIKGRGLELGDSPTLGEKAKEQSPFFSEAAVSERETKMDNEYGFRKGTDKFAVDNKGYMDVAKKTVKEASSNFDFISGKYKNCEDKEETTRYNLEEVCDEYFDVQVNACMPKQVVEIDSKYTYQCTKKRQEKQKVCRDVLTKLVCNNVNSECDNGGIVLSTVKTNLQNQSYQYPTLYVGTPHWRPELCTRDDTKFTTFEVKSLSRIKEFTLARVRFDDHLLIKVNGHKVYLGPEDEGDKHDRLEVIKRSRYGTITTDGLNRKDCERSTNWNRYPDVDLIPYLKEGENKISITLVTAGYGNAELWIRARQQCCKEWIETREEKCEFQ
jgi:hypothetical protein